ncbi:cytochrome P450 10-like [Ostrea edulis]|uniref:cytochrome P450 10-like n=1 Tax=Ostrea edulis TaxID=37623 RepID=UPI0024AEDDAA|nr:cytochrome P450 10-like [Ostrea edulis]XP_048758644.2 cytochrome P450 10-like [Ostrea edulis]
MAIKGTTLSKALTKSFGFQKRVLSTSSTNRQAIAFTEVAPLSCPVKEALTTINRIMEPTKTPTEPTPQVQTSSFKSFDSIPGPKGLPVIGTLFDYMKKDGLRFNKLFEAYRQRALQFGPIFKENIANISTVVISDPVEYNKVIRADGKHPKRHLMEPWYYYREKKKLGQGLVDSQGSEWHKLRTVVSKKMLKMKEVFDYCTDMDEVARDFTDHLSTLRNQQNEVVGIEKELFKWSMESMGTFLFDSRIGCLGPNPPQDAQDFIENLQGFFKLMQPLMYNVPLYKIVPTKIWKQYEKHADNIFKIGRSFVDKKAIQLQQNPLQEGEKSSFIHYMMNQKSLTENEALSTVVDMLISATETTSSGTLWALYCLANNPEVQAKLYEETKRVLPNNETITPETLSQLQYVKAVMKETFRLYPITFATTRYLAEDTEVAGYTIPAGTHVQGNLYGMFRDSKLFPEPETFKPERWLKENQMNQESKALSNLVWGHGARMCIGRRFAEQEMHILVTKIVQNFRLEYNHGPVGAVLNTVMTPDRPLHISFIPRN